MTQTKIAVGMVDASGTPGSGNFLRGDGTWNAAGGDFVKITTSTASGASSIDFTSSHFDNSTYKSYQWILENIISDSDADAFYFRTSTDGGSTYLGTAGAPQFKYEMAGTGVDESGNSRQQLMGSNNEWRLSATGTNINLSNASTEELSGNIWMFNAGAAKRTHYTVFVSYISDTSKAGHFLGGGSMKDAEDTDGVRFLMQSGNITGSITMYGIK